MDIKLVNGITIPQIGFGTFKVDDGQQVINAVKHALKTGYRHIDTAKIYGNEEGIGRAIKESGIPRSEIFITSKVWNTDQGYESTLAAFDETLKKLDTDYLDLYLIHWPKDKNIETWKALETIYKEGRVRAIGVSNFKIHHLEELFKYCDIQPMVNQVELHPEFPQGELSDYCFERDIVIEAWSPLMQGKIDEIPLLAQIAAAHGKTAAQVALRWNVQSGHIVLPKSITPSRIDENFNIFDFSLTDVEMEALKALDIDQRIGPDPDEITF